MPDRRTRYTPLVQDCTKKTVPLTTRITPAAVKQIETAACSLGIPRHYILKAALRLGTPLAIAELTAKASSAAAGKVE